MADKTVYIGEAMRSEKNNDKTGWGGTTIPGDQLQKSKDGKKDTEGEVRIDPWRSGFEMVARYIDRDKAKAHVEALTFFCNSLHVGYNQAQRLSLKNAVKSLGYANYKKLNKDKETDCSALQCLCCNIVGISAVKDWNSTSMLKEFPKLTNDFIIYTDDKHLNSSDYLMAGDILIKDGHAAGVLNDGPKANEDNNDDNNNNLDDKDGNGLIDTLVKPESKNPKIAGIYTATTAVNMRYGPSSKEYDSIKVINENEEVTCEGEYTGDWYYVYDNKGTYGYIKKDYLKFKASIGKSTELALPKSKNTALAGKYVATEDVNMRYGPSSQEYEVIRVIKKGELVNNYGYYTGSWLYVKDTKGNKGYINKSYLKKK